LNDIVTPPIDIDMTFILAILMIDTNS